MIKKICKMFVLTPVLVCLNAEASFFSENSSGWHWYQNLEPMELHAPRGTFENQDNTIVASQMVNDYKKELENRLHVAWVNPTFKNLQAYQELQKDMMDKAEYFSEMWMKVLYNNPHLDHTLITPVNHKSRHLYFDQKKQQITEVIQNLAEDYGLFFFFDSQCRFCQEFSPIVKLFSKTYKWEVLPITADGGSLAEYPEPLLNNGIISQWKIEAFPALFAVNPKTSDVVPIAYGMTSIDEIETRIMLLNSLKEIKK